MSVSRNRKPSHAGRPRRFSARGFTIVSTAVSTMVAGILLAGAWMSYASMLRQWKIGTAERQMDQYAAATMQELTNDLSWAWAGLQMQGGQSLRWKFLYDDKFDDQLNRNERFSQTWLGRLRDPLGFITVTYNPNLGILFNGQLPPWAGDRWHTQYKFLGTTPHRNETRDMDRRDRMTVEQFAMDYQDYRTFGRQTVEDRIRSQGVVVVTLVLQYTYHGTYPQSDLGLYGDYYVREREYNTEISMKNWDVDGNAYRDSLLHHAG